MEKNRGAKIIAIIALLVAVSGLSLGFAAFSNSLMITPEANVNPNSSTFNVDFSSSNTALETNEIVPEKSIATITATDAIIDNTSVPTISNLSATFTEPGQSVTYTFYAYNSGEYDAFLKTISYVNANSASTFKVCTASNGTNDTLVQAACNSINVKVKAGNEAETTGTVASISGHKLEKDNFETITVTLEYQANGARADGDFSVKFGEISLGYSSVD